MAEQRLGQRPSFLGSAPQSVSKQYKLKRFTDQTLLLPLGKNFGLERTKTTPHRGVSRFPSPTRASSHKRSDELGDFIRSNEAIKSLPRRGIVDESKGRLERRKSEDKASVTDSECTLSSDSDSDFASRCSSSSESIFSQDGGTPTHGYRSKVRKVDQHTQNAHGIPKSTKEQSRAGYGTTQDAADDPPSHRSRREEQEMEGERPQRQSKTDAGLPDQLNDFAALLTYSPPPKSPAKVRSCTTPEPSTPRDAQGGKLSKSTTKKPRLPASIHRQSSDEFWLQELNDEWVDEHSPRKEPSSSHTPSKSKCSLPQSPKKGLLAEKRAFSQRKAQLAQDFLTELDDTLSEGQLQALTASDGGVRIIWSKTLNTTAGRANYKKQSIKASNQEPTYRHIASIELAEKVIDDEVRLLNVIAHEYCHLANFMVSGIRDRPHGKEFKIWASKCSQQFRHRGIHVTTKHAYDIDYKYVWQCVQCSLEYKRHSKSIDPLRHRCGACKSSLAQIKPVPRDRSPNKYQQFVKDRYKLVKDAHPQSPQKEIMSLISAEYRTLQLETSTPSESSSVKDDRLDTIAESLGAVSLS